LCPPLENEVVRQVAVAAGDAGELDDGTFQVNGDPEFRLLADAWGGDRGFAGVLNQDFETIKSLGVDGHHERTEVVVIDGEAAPRSTVIARAP
jgi:hypothetical protein